MTKFQAPIVPYVEAYLSGTKQKPTAITLDLSETTSEKGAALGIANRLHASTSPSRSYHYTVDEAETYQGVWDHVASFGNPYRAISVLLCADVREEDDMWAEPMANSAMHNAAKLIAKLVLTYKIRPRYLEGKARVRWLKRRSRRRGGIMLRIPGAWSREEFLDDIRACITVYSLGGDNEQHRLDSTSKS